MRKTIVCVGGARPNFVKLAPLVESLRQDSEFRVRLVHTGQHHDHRMAGSFFEQLGLPAPDYSLAAGSGSHGVQTARVLERSEAVFEELAARGERPAAVVVVGDVNSTLAAALAAAKLGLPVVHVEAGLRSFDRSMPEEINRLATDAISDLLLASERSGVANLRAEGVRPERIALVGNLMIDSLHQHREAARLAWRRAAPAGFGGRYGVVTLHRPANVDDPARLAQLIGVLEEIARELPLVFPLHPRTRNRVAEAGIAFSSRLTALEPLGYQEFLGLVEASETVLTDSGGIQEETTALGIPCLTLRDNTERPATVEEGTNILAGTSPDRILRAFGERPARRAQPSSRMPWGWDGKAAGRIHARLRDFVGLEAIELAA